MATWREFAICTIVSILLLLAAHRVAENQQVLCENLFVPPRLIHDEPDTVNRMLEVCGFHNVRVTSKKGLEKQIEAYHNVTSTAKNSPTAAR